MKPGFELTGIALLVIACVFALCTPKLQSVPTKQTAYSIDQFVMGADLSYVNQVEDYGGVFRDSGIVRDPFRIFRDHGANLVRVRLWYNPQWQAELNKGRLYNDIVDVMKTIRRAKNAGMGVNLNLHYSDTWADPAHQDKPVAWQQAGMNALKDSVYDYTLRVLNHLKQNNLVPEMIQVGNENNEGMLFPDGKVINGNWTAFVALLNSGIRAVRDFSKTSSVKPRIILHVAQLQNANAWLDGVMNKGAVTDFDIIGLSHYQKWSEITALKEVSVMIRDFKSRYKKDIMIVETAYPWTSENADNYNNIVSGTDVFDGYRVSREEQLRYLRDLVQQVIDGGGTGIMYWEPAWITSSLRDRWGKGSAWDNMTLFDFNGNALPGIDYMNPSYKITDKN